MADSQEQQERTGGLHKKHRVEEEEDVIPERGVENRFNQ